MGPRNPLLIVKEYLEPSEPLQVRRNALSALAALDDADSLTALAEIAVTGPDPLIRQHAEAEIAALPPAGAALALPRLFQDLTDRATRQEAYALLGRLRGVGMSFRFPSLAIGTRLMLAKSLLDRRYPSRGIKFHLRTAVGVSAGMFVGWVLLLFCLTWMLNVQAGSEFIGFMFGAFYIFGWILAFLIAAFATRLTSPIRYHADPAAGVLLDMLTVAVTSAAIAGVVAFLETYEEPEKNYDGLVALLLIAPCTAMAVRAGTMAAFGLARNRRLNYFGQIVVGGLCALAVYEIAAIVSGTIASRVVSYGWVWTMLTGFGLAGAFARIDNEAQSARVAPPLVSAGASALALVAVAIAALSMVGLPERRIELGPITDLPRSVEMRNVPASIAFGSTVVAEVTLDSPAYAVTVMPSAAMEGARPSVQALEARIVRKDDVTGDDMFDYLHQLTKLLTWPQLKARITRIEPEDGPALVTASITEQALAEPPATP